MRKIGAKQSDIGQKTTIYGAITYNQIRITNDLKV